MGILSCDINLTISHYSYGLGSMGANFECNTESITGAALLLRGDAHRKIGLKSRFRIWASPRWSNWERFVARPDSDHADFARQLHLVWGHTKTSSWAAFVFQSQAGMGQVRFGFNVPNLGGINMGGFHESSHQISPRKNHGPWITSPSNPPVSTVHSQR